MNEGEYSTVTDFAEFRGGSASHRGAPRSHDVPIAPGVGVDGARPEGSTCRHPNSSRPRNPCSCLTGGIAGLGGSIKFVQFLGRNAELRNAGLHGSPLSIMAEEKELTQI